MFATGFARTRGRRSLQTPPDATNVGGGRSGEEQGERQEAEVLRTPAAERRSDDTSGGRRPPQRAERTGAWREAMAREAEGRRFRAAPARGDENARAAKFPTPQVRKPDGISPPARPPARQAKLPPCGTVAILPRCRTTIEKGGSCPPQPTKIFIVNGT
ncbi:MAG: hypothetical protein LCI00_04750 [Chloroflexi bacterium]|nr:hypothetical protein [Chloroflexota bacterium]MCC6896362.1 hypothetical protein [Anaerolineae bacterium]